MQLVKLIQDLRDEEKIYNIHKNRLLSTKEKFKIRLFLRKQKRVIKEKQKQLDILYKNEFFALVDGNDYVQGYTLLTDRKEIVRKAPCEVKKIITVYDEDMYKIIKSSHKDFYMIDKIFLAHLNDYILGSSVYTHGWKKDYEKPIETEEYVWE